MGRVRLFFCGEYLCDMAVPLDGLSEVVGSGRWSVVGGQWKDQKPKTKSLGH